MEIKDRFFTAYEYLKEVGKISSLQELGSIIGTNKAGVSDLKHNRKKISIEHIVSMINSYDEIDFLWLLTGKGSMLKENGESITHKTEASNTIPLIPIEAMGGYGRGESQVMQYDINSGYNIPELEGKGVKYLIRVSGSSMYPKYSNGDLLACKPLEDLAFFQWGKPYVLDTEQGAIVKRLFPCDEDNECLECHSDNKTHYPPFKIPKSSVRAVAIVVGVIRLE